MCSTKITIMVLMKYELWLLLATLIIQPPSLKSCFYEERLALLEINSYMKSFVDPGRVFQGIDENGAKNCCGWERVRCDPMTQHVIDLNLSSMISRDSSSWSFNVTLLSPFVYLTTLDLSENSLGGLVEKNGLINGNQGRATEYSQGQRGNHAVINLSQHLLLEKMDLSNNKLHGVLPSNIGLMLPRVTELNMSRNSFEGNVPDSMGKMTRLGILDLSRNNFSGKLPTQLMSDCSTLSILQLSDNNLQGDIIPEQMNLPYLFRLKLNNNRFSGKIKDSLLRSPRLNHLDISGNEVIGGLPSWIGNFSILFTLSMSNNLFQGTIPAEICHIPLRYLDLSSNNLIGSVPSCLFSTTVLYLRDNNLTGTLSNALSGISSNVNILDLSDNQLSGSIAPVINKLHGLQVLLLRGNNLQGEIPEQLCELQDIRILDLSHNKLTGDVPSCFGNMFRGTSHITPFHQEVVYPSGYSESDLYSIPEVVAILVKHNYLHYIGDVLVLMIGIDMSCNKLTGVIPPELGNLMQVHSLNLSHNSLSGSIPSSFANLKQAESVDLSYNKLNGSIPPQLVQLNFLSFFNVSYNYLRGKVPDGGQFGKLDESNFIGNPQLCGLLVNKSCNTVTPPSIYGNSTNVTENGDVEEDFFWSFGVSCGIAFVTTAVILCINPRWREAWFEFVGWHLLWWLPFDFL